MSVPVRILYMEDDAGLARLFQKRLQRKGYIVDLAHDGDKGLKRYEAALAAGRPYDVIAIDHLMPIYDGLEVMRLMSQRGEVAICCHGNGCWQRNCSY